MSIFDPRTDLADHADRILELTKNIDRSAVKFGGKPQFRSWMFKGREADNNPPHIITNSITFLENNNIWLKPLFYRHAFGEIIGFLHSFHFCIDFRAPIHIGGGNNCQD